MLEETWKDAILRKGEENFWLQKDTEIKIPLLAERERFKFCVN